MWDPDTALRRMGGDHSLLSKMIAFFIEDSETLLVSLEGAFDLGQFEESARAAHSLKGLCLNFDAFASAEMAEFVESRCYSIDDRVTRIQIQSLRESVQHLRSHLLEWSK